MNGLKTFYATQRLTLTYIALWPLLFVASVLYFLIVAALKILYQTGVLASYRPRTRVISIGNITLGGSGKTPLAQYLAGELSVRNHRVAVLLRGYGKPKKNKGLGSGDYYALGDEAAMLKESLKGRAIVLSNPDRVGEARMIDQEGHFDTIILDDGFQHWRLKRDLDIVVLDSTNPFGNGCVLPLGVLRESPRALSRAHVFCLARCDEAPSEQLRHLEERLKKINPSACVVRAIHVPEHLVHALTGEKIPLEALRGVPVGVISGIANPASFAKSLTALGALLVSKHFFDDHHEYTRQEIAQALLASGRAQAKFLVTTEKDIVRFNHALPAAKVPLDIVVLKISLEIVKGKESLDERLRFLYRA